MKKPRNKKASNLEGHDFKTRSLWVVSGNHLIEDFLMMRSYCGLRLSGWRYIEHVDESICDACKSKVMKGAVQE